MIFKCPNPECTIDDIKIPEAQGVWAIFLSYVLKGYCKKCQTMLQIVE